MRRTGTYANLIQGVSQQTPQQRTDGQLSEQINMTSDIVTGLRRRTGFAYQYRLTDTPPNSWFHITELNGVYYLQVVTPAGTLRIQNLSTGAVLHDVTYPYFSFSNKSSIRSVVLGNAIYILNTEKIPSKINVSSGSPTFNPQDAGWIVVKSGAFSKNYTVTISRNGDPTLTYSHTTPASNASEATSESVAHILYTQMTADTNFTSRYTAVREGNVIGIKAINPSANTVVISNTVGDTYMTTSEDSTISLKTLLPPSLPSMLNTYVMGVGSGRNIVYYQYNHTTKKWVESGTYEQRYKFTNVGYSWYYNFDTSAVVITPLEINGRTAGDDDNNPVPEFFTYGITGVSAYQSRLVILSGSYVNMSRSNDPKTFMRTTVAELLDDDAIEISATSLSNNQFEYAIPYNKDLVLFARNQQAVIPNNSTVLTPKTAAIYPTTTSDVSLACSPTVIARSLYYTYLRGGASTSYQVGELLPSPYTDSQYSTQSTTDHLPLYATGICTCMSGSTAGNLAMFTNDTEEVLVNQFYWVGDERPLMAYHKWNLGATLRVHYHQQVNDQILMVVSIAEANQVFVVATTLQLNQLKSKPVPYLDMYTYLTLDSNGQAALPVWYGALSTKANATVVQYSDTDLRYMEVAYTTSGGTITVPECAGETVVIGFKYVSGFELTPPFLKDAQGGVVSGTRSTLQSLVFTFKDTSTFTYQVSDTYGNSNIGETSAPSWSEISIGSTWINDVSTTMLPCRVRLNSARIALATDSTTDMNVLTAEYTIRIPDRDLVTRSRR